MRQQYLRLLMFDLWCNRKLADVLRAHTDFKERPACIAFLSHIVAAQDVWFSRVLDIDTEGYDTWPGYEPEELKPIAKEYHQKWMDLVADHDIELDTTIYYRNSKGTPFNNTISDIVSHMIIHGQHHRAQISLLLRRSGIEPPPIDYIFYTRQV